MLKLNKYKIDGNTTYHKEFNRLIKKIKFDIVSAYKNYAMAAENNIKEKPNKFWSHINNKKGVSPTSKTMKFYNGNRIQYVTLNGFKSAEYKATSRVP